MVVGAWYLRSLNFWLVLVLLFVGSGGGVAATQPISAAVLLLNIPSEISLPETREIKDQAAFPYCTLYAMSSFLELWGNNGHGRQQQTASLDPAFLAVAYNAEVENGTSGVDPLWLMPVVQKYGVIPHGSKVVPGSKFDWPLRDWKQAHQELMSIETARGILEAKYSHPDFERRFTGQQFLQKILKVDFKEFKLLYSNYRELFLHPSREVKKAEFREGSWRQTQQKLNELAESERVDTSTATEDPSTLLGWAVRQLYEEERPALLSINPRMTQKSFWRYEVIGSEDLVEVGKAYGGAHEVVLVAHCDRTFTADPICGRFGSEMAARGVDECLVIQNSWGMGSHATGYACLAPSALSRMLNSVIVMKKWVK